MNSRLPHRMLIVTALALLCVAGTAHGQSAPARRVVFGLQTPQEGSSYEELREVWREAERLGFESAWVYDHFIPIIGDQDGPALDGWTLLAALVRDTERMRIGILVTGNTYRHPAVLAKIATTVDQVSGGRLDFGIGAGWFEPEHKAYGIPFYTARERAERLGEALEVITRLWREEKASYAGKYYQLVDAPFFPKPVQKPWPPIVIGGQGKKWTMPLVGRYADEWNVPIRMTPAGIAGRLAIARRACEAAKRPSCDLRVSALLPLVNITGIPLVGTATRLGARVLYDKNVAQAALTGSPDAVKAKIQEYVDAGVTRVIINMRAPFDRDLLRRFATDVMPAFTGGQPRG